MKNYNILGVHWKIQLLGVGVTKNQYRRGDCVKGGGSLDSLLIWGGWCFGEEGWYPNAHYEVVFDGGSILHLILWEKNIR